MIVYRRLINMVPGGQVAVVNMSQYDSDVTLEFELYASEGTFVVQDGTTVLIRGTKPDGNGISLDGTLESTQDPKTGQYVHLVTVEVTQQMTAVAGKALYELSLRKDNVELNTANFVLDIERAPLDADTVPSESVIREIGKAVEKYMDEHDIVIDDTLTQQGKAADAKKTGNELTSIKQDLEELDEKIDAKEGISNDVKTALLNVVSHIALWTDDKGQEYYDALHDALYGEEYPDLTTGSVVYGYYFDNNGNAVASESNWYNEKYFPISQNTTYVWVRGFDGFAVKANNTITTDSLAYRVCYYDSNKVFISREVSEYSSELGYVEQRYFELTPPQNAAFFRVSWSKVPVGNIYRSIPRDLYAVTLVLANPDDSNINKNTDLMSRVTFIRNGVGVLQDVVYGRSDINIPNYDGEIPDNNSAGLATFRKSIWFRDVFDFVGGYSPEDSGIHGPNPDTLTRIQNRDAFLMKEGDIIRFNNVKAGVRAERICDGYVQHTTGWITDNSDFVIGGE